MRNCWLGMNEAKQKMTGWSEICTSIHCLPIVLTPHGINRSWRDGRAGNQAGSQAAGHGSQLVTPPTIHQHRSQIISSTISASFRHILYVNVRSCLESLTCAQSLGLGAARKKGVLGGDTVLYRKHVLPASIFQFRQNVTRRIEFRYTNSGGFPPPEFLTSGAKLASIQVNCGSMWHVREEGQQAPTLLPNGIAHDYTFTEVFFYACTTYFLMRSGDLIFRTCNVSGSDIEHVGWEPIPPSFFISTAQL